MGVSELEESSSLLDEKLLRFMDQLELLEEKRATLNSLIEQVTQETWRLYLWLSFTELDTLRFSILFIFVFSNL